MFRSHKDKKTVNLKPLVGVIFFVAIALVIPIAKPQPVYAAVSRCYNDLLTPKFFNCNPASRLFPGGPSAALIKPSDACYSWFVDPSLPAPRNKGWVKESCNAGVFFHGAVAHNGLPDNLQDITCTLNNGEAPSGCSIFSIYLFPIIDLLAVGIGVLVAIMIVVGGIQYSSARGDPNAVASAKKKIANALLGLVSFGLLWSFIQWIVPGGIF